jgi:class 3 adenylate cyclase/predicted ATPase/ABC-type transport system involved in cytochrome c biogenesis ATPase subunit
MSERVTQWLEQLGLGEYATVFADNDIDWELLPELDQETLKEIGITSAGHRLRILKSIKTIQSEPSDRGQIEEKASVASSSAAEQAEAERRQLTVMFCDLVGSTSLAERLDPEDFRDIIRSYQDACAGAISRFEGYVARYVGDGLLVYFGFPRAHEDDAERALHAALGILAAMEKLSSRLEQTLEVRIGVATGHVVVGDIVGDGAAQEQTVIGETPNLAARLQGLADPNSVVIAASTRDLIGEQFLFEDLGFQSLKGISDAVQAWRVLGERAVESRFGAAHAGRLTAFVGREQEVELLLERWRRARAGEGQVVLLSGEAGIGKSRITETLRSRLSEQDYTRIQYQCSPHHTNSPLYPAIQQLSFAAGIKAEDTPERQLDKLEALTRQSSAPAEDVALMAALLSIPSSDRYPLQEMSPQEQKQRTLQALIGLFEGIAKQKPVLLVLEDAHWVDPTTLEQMDMAVDRVSTLPALILVTHRPEFEAPWTGRAHCTVLALNRLGREACAALISDVSGGCELPGEVLEQIISKTDGVPLFVEELTKTVLESGLLEHQDGRYVLRGPLPPLAIPSTLHDSLMARLDRLEGIKEIGQIGAAIGREFSHRLLDAVSPLHGQALEEALATLIESEIVFRRGVAPDATYVFKHALIQDAAYEALLRSRRQQIHARIAEALQGGIWEGGQSEPEVLAHHYTEAGLLVEAAPLWLEAGQRAVARSANHEATAHLSQGLTVLEKLPKDRDTASLELDMQISLGSASIGTRGYSAEETEKAYVRGRELLDEIGDDPRQFAVLHGLSMCYINQAKLKQDLDVAEEMLRRAEPQNDPMSRLVAHRVMAVTQNIMARFTSARENAERAAALFDQEQHQDSAHHYGHDQKVATDWHLSIALMFLGFADGSNRIEVQASTRAHELEHANTILYDSLYSAFTSLVKRDWSRARRVAEAMIEFAATRSMALWVVFGRHHLGAALAALGESQEALNEIHRGRDEASRLNHWWLRPMTLRFEAQALADLGRADEAFACVDDALGLVEATEERWWEAEIHRFRGELNLRYTGSPEQSEASFRRSIDIARAQESRLMELRAATSLGRLWRDQGRSEEALDLIAPVYEWFTEGLDTSDLKEAKALLEELS